MSHVRKRKKLSAQQNEPHGSYIASHFIYVRKAS